MDAMFALYQNDKAFRQACIDSYAGNNRHFILKVAARLGKSDYVLIIVKSMRDCPPERFEQALDPIVTYDYAIENCSFEAVIAIRDYYGFPITMLLGRHSL
jgi:hypothetical protein